MGNSEQLRPLAEDSDMSVTGLSAGRSNVTDDQECQDTVDPWLEPTLGTSCFQKPPRGRHHGASTAATSAATRAHGPLVSLGQPALL